MVELRVGVLALQGGFAPHLAVLRSLGHTAVEVRTAADLDGLDGLVLPGGESTTHLTLLDRFGMNEALDTFGRSGKPVLCTCAGLILAAREVVDPAQRSFGWLDVKVARNAWGRQVHSFEALSDAPLPDAPDGERLPLLFIRAPRILEVGPTARTLATLDGEPIVVAQGAVVGAAFHPELIPDARLHAFVFGGHAAASATATGPAA